MEPMIFATTVVGVVSLSQVVFITIAWQRLRDMDKKIDEAVAQLRAEMRQLRAEIKQSEVQLRAEIQQLAVELRAEIRQGIDRTHGMVVGLAERFGKTEQRVSHLEGRENTAATL